MTPYDPQKHHRRSIRLKGYNYAQPGAYFITLVTHRRDTIFGQIIQKEMQLSALGRIVHEEWMRSISLRREICLNADEFVIMPNHLHGIVWIIHPVGADGVRPIAPPNDEEGARRAPQPEAPQPGVPQPRLNRLPRSLSSFVAGFKSSVTGRAGRELGISGIWQRNYYDHIIRNEREFKRIWNYIDTNPQRWQEDQLHPAAPPNSFNQG